MRNNEKKWLRMIMQMVKDYDKINQIKCPNCGENGIDYIYIGDESTRIGFLLVWCNKCLKGTYMSRVIAPSDVKFVTFETDLESIVPRIEFV